nr:TIM barrel protein [Desulfuromonadales bacterium]
MNLSADSLYIQVPFARLDALLERLVAERLQPEIGFTGPDLDRVDFDRLDAIAARLGAAGLRLTVHAPYNDLNPGALDPLVANITAERIRRTLECAARLGARLVVVHPGYDPWRYGFHEDLWLERAADFWPPL